MRYQVTQPPRWRPHTETPSERYSAALIAMPDLDDPETEPPYILGIYIWSHDAEWRCETNGAPMRQAVYWWLPETELLATLPRAGS